MKNLIYYIYVLLVIIIGYFLARPIINTTIHPLFTYALLLFSPAFSIIRGLTSLKYKGVVDYSSGVFLLIIILIFRHIYL